MTNSCLSTSNAVERGNRRHRKMRNSVYRVRQAPQFTRRIALDMLREARVTRMQNREDPASPRRINTRPIVATVSNLLAISVGFETWSGEKVILGTLIFANLH